MRYVNRQQGVPFRDCEGWLRFLLCDVGKGGTKVVPGLQVRSGFFRLLFQRSGSFPWPVRHRR